MLVLGKKYKFTPLELERLQRKFPVIIHVDYKDRNVDDVLAEIATTLENQKIKLIVLNTRAAVDNKIIKYLTHLQFDHNVKYIGIEHFLEKHLHKCYIPSTNNELHFLDHIKPFAPLQILLKRIIDIVSITLLTIVASPAMIYSYFKIKKTSPGPILFEQDRVGHNNKEFVCLKFRSMHVDAEKDGAQFAKKNDTRIYPYGEKMRKYRIDELPQMLNVLKGEMHLIGPRPERKHWTDQFEEIIPYYMERHLVAPGITGWAQVMYPYGANAEDAKQKLMYDLYYIKHWSIILELKVIWKTVLVVVGKKGV